MAAHVNFRRTLDSTEGLRSRKKARTRLAIEEAASALFAEQGYEATTIEQISERAEISHMTFFRYFPSKAHVIISGRDNAPLPALQSAIVDRPDTESDMLALQRAIELVWVPAIDPVRTMSTARAVAESTSLRGLYEEMNREWAGAIAEALARRRGADVSDESCKVIARTAISVLESSVETWMANKCRDALADAVQRNFQALGLAFERRSADVPRRRAKRAG
jgi:AcrR family transcriptional regulator